jgi:hypothetical protein
MKPHVCPKCDGESARMAGCAPCKGTGVVWETQTLAPNPYVYQPYIIPIPSPGIGGTQPWPFNPSDITITYTGNTCSGDALDGEGNRSALGRSQSGNHSSNVC